METEFRSLALPAELLSAVEGLGFSTPTPIQARAIPLLLNGKDIVGQSVTGSGKTATFALPILSRLNLATREIGALVLCPTRELAAQVAREFRKLGRNLPGLSVLVLGGGEPLRAQKAALEYGVHLVVGTPGRVLDHLRRRNLKVHRVGILVLDEADRMLSMGFQEDIERILKALPAQRQTLFFSATFPASIESLSQKYQQNPVWVRIEEAQEPLEIRQLVHFVKGEQKLEALRWVLATHPHESALVFANFKTSVKEIEQALGADNVSVASLHGDLEQFDRDRVMAKFRNRSTRVLVATDVAARGIDVPDLDLVVNFELPTQPEIYVHRIGRTGRAGKAGLAISLCAESEQLRLSAIEEVAAVSLTRLARDGAKAVEPGATQQLNRGAAMITLRISGGRKEKLRPGDILGALTGEAAGLSESDVGKIEIHEHFSYVAIASHVGTTAQKQLNDGRIKGRKFKVTNVT